MIENYVNNGFELIDEHKEEVFLKYHGLKFILTKEDIEGYKESLDFNSGLNNLPVECSVCGNNYREQMVRPLQQRPIHYFIRKSDIIFGASDSDQIYVKLGSASIQFKNYFRFNEHYLEYYKRIKFQIRKIIESEKGYIDIREILYDPITIKVFNINESNLIDSIKKSDKIIESCFFELSYLKQLPLGLMEEFTRLRKKKKKNLLNLIKEKTKMNFLYHLLIIIQIL